MCLQRACGAGDCPTCCLLLSRLHQGLPACPCKTLLTSCTHRHARLARHLHRAGRQPAWFNHGVWQWCLLTSPCCCRACCCVQTGALQALLETVIGPDSTAAADGRRPSPGSEGNSPVKIALFSIGNMCAHKECRWGPGLGV